MDSTVAAIKELRANLKESTDSRVLIGFDGFVDEIIYVVDKRIDAQTYIRLNTITEYSERIAQAAGYSTNIEYVPIQTKIGGNGPIYANAIAMQGGKVCYVGALGKPIRSVFDDFVNRCEKVVSLSQPAQTDAVEFIDGKLIISKLGAFSQITYERIIECFGKQEFINAVSSSDLIGFTNWTMISSMNSIFEQFLANIAPQAAKSQFVFFDLADPQKRSNSDILSALLLIREFNHSFKVVLGMNYKEAVLVAKLNEVEFNSLEELALGLYKKLGLFAIVIHPLKEACCVIDDEYYHINGPYCTNPLLTTGAGDNFNGGFCAGLLQQLTPLQALTLGVSTSGFYVRTGISPDLDNIRVFLNKWINGEI